MISKAASEGMVLQVVACDLFPSFFGTVCSSNPFIFFVFYRGVCHLLHFKALSEWISHVAAFSLSLPHWTDPDPPFFSIKRMNGC